jgi:hypothetical protein
MGYTQFVSGKSAGASRIEPGLKPCAGSRGRSSGGRGLSELLGLRRTEARKSEILDSYLFDRTRSENIGRRVLDSDAGTLEPFTVLLGGNVSETVANAKPEKNAVFGSIALVPITWEPGRYGLARTLFEILSFERTGIRAQVLVWSLARKASYSFPKSDSK